MPDFLSCLLSSLCFPCLKGSPARRWQSRLFGFAAFLKWLLESRLASYRGLGGKGSEVPVRGMVIARHGLLRSMAIYGLRAAKVGGRHCCGWRRLEKSRLLVLVWALCTTACEACRQRSGHVELLVATHEDIAVCGACCLSYAGLLPACMHACSRGGSVCSETSHGNRGGNNLVPLHSYRQYLCE